MRLLPWLFAALLTPAGATLLHQRGAGASSERLSAAAAAEHGGNETASAAGDGPLGLALHHSSRSWRDKDFPRVLPPDRKLLGKLKYVLNGFHVDDIGIYLSKKSKLWGRQATPEEFTEGVLGDLTLRYRIASPFFTRRRWSKWLIGTIFKYQVKKAKCGNVDEEVSQMQGLIEAGPKFHPGSKLDFDLDKDGMAYTCNGVAVKKGGSACSGTATLFSYMSEECISEDWKRTLLKTLRNGVDAEAEALVANEGRPGLVWGIIIGVLVVLAACCTACVWYCCGAKIRKCCCA